jgi:hypothetical protein
VTKDERLVLNIGFTKEGDYTVLEYQEDGFRFEDKTIQVTSD